MGAVTRAGKGYLVLVASDASDHTWRRAKSFVAGTEQQCVRLPYSKDEMGMAVGRSSLAIAAVTDAALALALVKSLPDGDAAAEEALSRRTEKLNQRKKEARAHQRNLRKGKK